MKQTTTDWLSTFLDDVLMIDKILNTLNTKNQKITHVFWTCERFIQFTSPSINIGKVTQNLCAPCNTFRIWFTDACTFLDVLWSKFTQSDDACTFLDVLWSKLTQSDTIVCVHFHFITPGCWWWSWMQEAMCSKEWWIVIFESFGYDGYKCIIDSHLFSALGWYLAKLSSHLIKVKKGGG